MVIVLLRRSTRRTTCSGCFRQKFDRGTPCCCGEPPTRDQLFTSTRTTGPAPTPSSAVARAGRLRCRKTIEDIKRPAQVQYNYNTRIFFLCCSCIALVRTLAIQRCNTCFLQLAENLQATCSSCKKTCIVVALHLCGLLQYN